MITVKCTRGYLTSIQAIVSLSTSLHLLFPYGFLTIALFLLP